MQQLSFVWLDSFVVLTTSHKRMTHIHTQSEIVGLVCNNTYIASIKRNFMSIEWMDVKTFVLP